MKIIPLYDQGTVVYVMLPDDADLDRLWLAAEKGNILVKGEME